MSHKIRLIETDIIKARAAFKLLGGKMLPDTGLLSRTVLRALERKGLVEKVVIVGRRKYTDSTPPMRYLYLWKNQEEMGHASAASSENRDQAQER